MQGNKKSKGGRPPIRPEDRRIVTSFRLSAEVVNDLQLMIAHGSRSDFVDHLLLRELRRIRRMT
jgi:hypothetical protein